MAATRPKTEADIKAIERRHELARAVLEEGKIVASGRRKVNRPRDEQKQARIDEFLRERRIDGYHVFEADLADEDECRWHDDNGIPTKSLRDSLTDEVSRAFACAGEASVPMASVYATKLLESDLGGKLGVLGDLPANKVTVELVLAHFEALAYDVPQRIAYGIARRSTVLLMNRGKFDIPAPTPLPKEKTK